MLAMRAVEYLELDVDPAGDGPRDFDASKVEYFQVEI